MTAPRGWFSNRGSAILGALALVAVLGILAVVLDDNFQHVVGETQSAQAATPSNPNTASKPKIESKAPKSCAEAIKRALGSTRDPTSESTAESRAGTVDACYGARLKAGVKTPSQKISDYECVGRMGTATLDNGKLTLNTFAPYPEQETHFNVRSVQGKCHISYCEKKPLVNGLVGQNCQPMQEFKTGTRITAPPPSGELPGSVTGGAPASGTGGPTAPGGAPTGAGVDDAFKNQPVTSETTKTDVSCNDKTCEAYPSGKAEADYLKTEGFKCDLYEADSYACSKPAQGASPSDVKQWCTENDNANPACKGNTTLQPPPGYQGPCLNGLVMDPVTGKCRGAYQGPCLNGQEMNPATGLCSPPSQVRPPGCVGAACNPGPGRQAVETGRPDNRNSTFGGLGGLGSLLSGFAKGFSQPQPQQPQKAPAQQCSTDPNMYQQQQQQYQQELQQYNYQQQMYNYQMQQYYYQQQQQQQYGGYAYGAPPPMAPVQPSPCTPANSGQCLNQQQQQQPDPSLCTAGTWQAVRSGNSACITGWQCSNSGNLQASLSCEPKTADVGMTLAISYSCSRGTAEGRGFDVSAQPAGSASAVVASPPAGTNTATYTLTCSDSGKTASAQCSVQVAKPTIILVANPKSVKAGDASLLGWITSGMKSCVVSSPDQPDFTSRNSANTSVSGTATTSPITKETKFLLRCQTAGGGTKEATATVTTGGGDSSGQVTIASTADGKTVNHGDKVTITWNATGQPSGSAVAIWIVDTRTYATTALIAGSKGTSGSYEWTIPSADSTCPTDAANVCGRDLVAGREYLIEADVYTPQNAYVGDGARPSGAVDPEYGDYGDTTPAFTVGQ